MNDLPDAAPARPLRLWPGVGLAAVLVIVKLVVPLVAPHATPLTASKSGAGSVVRDIDHHP